ncbi:FHA domain-containing protein, partial [bacterium]|nr:FHA domain-containing protein [bacterium]
MTARIPILSGRDGAREIRYELREGRHAVGRAAESDLVLPHPSVSRRHAVLECRDGSVVLEDLGSHNGTRVNGATVQGRTPLARGDEIRFADVVLRLGEPGDTRHMLTL